MTPQELGLAHLRMAIGQEVSLEIPERGSHRWVGGRWKATGDGFMIVADEPNLAPDDILFVGRVIVRDPTGVHSFAASLRFEPPLLFRVLSIGQIHVEQRRSYIRIPVATRLRYRRLGSETDENLLPWGETRDISPAGLAFTGPSLLVEGDPVEIFFEEPPWRSVSPLRGLVVGLTRVSDGVFLHRVRVTDGTATAELTPLVTGWYRRLVAEHRKEG